MSNTTQSYPLQYLLERFMTFEAWFTLGIVTSCFFALALTRWATDAVLMCGLTILLIMGILEPAQALAGFANEGVITVAVLFIVSAGLKETAAIHWIAQTLFGKPNSVAHAQFRIMAPVAAMSALLNNTPVVAMLIPALNDWARKYQLSVSKLMIPLSYAAIIGGTCTLIGTSTNLVINGMLKTNTDNTNGLMMFELAWVGIPCVLITLFYVIIVSPWLLPERKPVINYSEDARQYVTEMMIDENSPLIGQTIEQAGLRQLPGAYLVEIERKGRILPAVSPEETLYAADRLVFAGVVDSMIDMQKIRGLTPAADQLFKLDAPRKDRCLIEAVISNTFPLLGKTIREGRFRTRYNAAIIAVARNGAQVQKKIGDISLQPGDTLLLETHQDFADRHRNSRDFFLVSRLDNSTPPSHERAKTAISILIGMVAMVTLGVMSMVQAGLLAAGLMIITKCLNVNNARRSIDLSILITIAAAFGIGYAMNLTGAANALADQLLGFTHNEPSIALGLIFAITAIVTAMITNNAAAVLMFPIALALAEQLNVSFMPFIITIMIAASASFATPIGYQTNLMVFGPGGYRFSDFIKMGLPLTILIGYTTVIITPMVWPF